MSENKVEVSADALRQLLQALINGGVEIREMMVLANSPILSDNPIKQLTAEYNAWAESKK